MKKQSSDKVTAIVGAGITGLTAACLLAKTGQKCLLLESEPQIGGLCRTYTLDGISFDLGPHLFFFNPRFKPDQFLLDLIKDEEFIEKRFSFAIKGLGRFWKMPLNIPDILFFYPLKYKWEMFKAILKKNRIDADPGSVRAMIEEKSGHTYWADLFGPLMKKKSLISGDFLHRDWAVRVDRDINNRKEDFSSLEISIGLRHKIKTILNPRYYYPAKGFQVIADKLHKEYCAAGGITQLECGPVSFKTQNHRVDQICFKNTSYPVKDVIWTAPVNEINRILGADIPPVESVDIIIALATYNRPFKTDRPYVYTYHIDNSVIFNRLYYPESIFGRKSMDKEGICAEISASPKLMQASDQEIKARVIDGIEREKVFEKKYLRECKIIRLKNAMPVYDLGYETVMQETFREIHKYQNLFSIGRRGGYFFCQTPAAIMQGVKVAEHLSRKSFIN